jgi:hypothetical protein
MHFMNSELHKGQFIPGGYLRFLLITMRVENHWPKIFCIKNIILCTVHRHKYSSPSIFYYIFHVRPHFFKKIF